MDLKVTLNGTTYTLSLIHIWNHWKDGWGGENHTYWAG